MESPALNSHVPDERRQRCTGLRPNSSEYFPTRCILESFAPLPSFANSVQASWTWPDYISLTGLLASTKGTCFIGRLHAQARWNLHVHIVVWFEQGKKPVLSWMPVVLKHINLTCSNNQNSSYINLQSWQSLLLVPYALHVPKAKGTPPTTFQ